MGWRKNMCENCACFAMACNTRNFGMCVRLNAAVSPSTFHIFDVFFFGPLFSCFGGGSNGSWAVFPPIFPFINRRTFSRAAFTFIHSFSSTQNIVYSDFTISPHLSMFSILPWWQSACTDQWAHCACVCDYVNVSILIRKPKAGKPKLCKWKIGSKNAPYHSFERIWRACCGLSTFLPYTYDIHDTYSISSQYEHILLNQLHVN